MIDAKKMNTYAAIHGTDKLGHGYVSHYAKHLPEKCESLLEIGAFKGASLRMWKDLYPKTKISCFDLFLDPDNISKEEVEAMGITAYKGDQGYPEQLAQVQGEFDVIVEDGSHRSDHQIITFKTLWPRVKPGGVYVCEDLHCCNEKFYWGSIKNFKDTFLGSLITHGNWFGEYEEQANVSLYDGKIVFIQKKV